MALEPPLRKVGVQKFDTMRPTYGYEKMSSFMALAQKVFGTDQKNQRGPFAPPPSPTVIGLSQNPV